MSMRDLDVRPIDKEAGKAIVLPNHYSGTWNTTFGLYNFGVFVDGQIRGAAVFGHLMNPASWSSIANVENMWQIIELNRLWLDDSLGHNAETAMLAKCFRWLRDNTSVQVVQSFADGRLGVGTIYKAANFGYYGREKTLFFVDLESRTWHNTQFSNTAKLSGMILRNELWVDGLLRPFYAYTYRYLLPLNKTARKNIVPKPMPYPAYERGEIDAPDYVHPPSVIARCYILCDNKGDKVRAQKFMDWLLANVPPEDFDALMDAAERNEYVQAAREESRRQPSLLDLFGDTA